MILNHNFDFCINKGSFNIYQGQINY